MNLLKNNRHTAMELHYTRAKSKILKQWEKDIVFEKLDTFQQPNRN